MFLLSAKMECLLLLQQWMPLYFSAVVFIYNVINSYWKKTDQTSTSFRNVHEISAVKHCHWQPHQNDWFIEHYRGLVSTGCIIIWCNVSVLTVL